MQQYSDFIEVNQDFMPVYSEFGGRSLWESFIPHQAFVQMLEELLNGLESGRPPWLQGPYGTGKTFAAYTLKHLFEEDIDSVHAYFERHKQLDQLWGKFSAARHRGPIFVIYHDSSAEDHADGLHLFYSIQQKIQEALRTHQLDDVAEENLLTQTLERIQASNWPHVFNRHRALFEEASDAQSVVDDLRAYPSPKLIIAVVRALLSEGIVVRQSAEDFRLWCQKLVKNNNLGGLIVLCDELTDYIRPGAPLTDLQGLAAHNSGSRFLFTPITHKLLTDAISDAATVRKIRERFSEVQFHMPTPTAFRLLKNCIAVRKDRADEWLVLRGKMEEDVCNLIAWLDSPIAENSTTKKVDGAQDLPALLPLHPFAAALLSRISEHYLSSQRTLFSFVSSANKEVSSPFQRFLLRSMDDEPRMLTADSLFHFFFVDNSIDLGDFADRAPLLISQYRQRQSSLDDDLSKCLYATITLLQILRATNKALDWQMPCETVLWNCYQGAVPRDDFDRALALLLEKQVLSAIERSGDREFVSPDATINYAKLQQYKDKFNAMTFERIAEDIKLHSKVLPRLEFRQEGLPQQQSAFYFATYDSVLKRRAGVVRGELQPYQMAFIVCVSHKDSEVAELRKICHDLAEENNLHVYIVLDSPFTDSKLQSLRECLAQVSYYEDVNDNNHKMVSQQQCDKIVDTWVDYAVRDTRIFARCLTDNPDGFAGESKTGMETCLKKTFYSGLWPHIREFSTLCKKGQTGKGAAQLVFGKGTVTNQTRPLLHWLEQLEEKPDTDNIKKMVGIIRAQFDQQEEVNLADLWHTLCLPPFGLYDSQASCLILAYALKDYVGRWYHFDEKANSDMLNQDSLSNLAARIVKGACKPKETLRIMSAADEKFCAFVRSICDLDNKEALFPDEACRRMNVWLNSVNYPLCGLHFLNSWQGEDLKEGRIVEAIALLAEVLANETVGVGLVRKQFTELLLVYPALQGSLAKVLTPAALQEGLQFALGPDTPRLANALHEGDISVAWLRSRLHVHHSRDMQYWTKETIVHLLPILEADFYLLTSVCDLLGQKYTTLEEGAAALLARMKVESLPLCVFDQVEVKARLPFILHLLAFLRVPGELNSVQRDSLASALARNKDTTRDILWRNLSATFQNWANPQLETPLLPEDIDAFYNEFSPIDLFIDAEKLISNLRRFQGNLTSRRSANRFKKAFVAVLGAEDPTVWSAAHGFPLSLVWPRADGHKVMNLFESGLNPAPQAFDDGAEQLKDSEAFAELEQTVHVAQRFVNRVAPGFEELVATTESAAELSQFLKVQLGNDVAAWHEADILPHVQEWASQQYSRRIKPQLVDWLEHQNQDALRHLLVDLMDDPTLGIKIRHKAKA